MGTEIKGRRVKLGQLLSRIEMNEIGEEEEDRKGRGTDGLLWIRRKAKQARTGHGELKSSR